MQSNVVFKDIDHMWVATGMEELLLLIKSKPLMRYPSGLHHALIELSREMDDSALTVKG